MELFHSHYMNSQNIFWITQKCGSLSKAEPQQLWFAFFTLSHGSSDGSAYIKIQKGGLSDGRQASGWKGAIRYFSVLPRSVWPQSLSHCELITDDGIRHLGNGACAHDQLEVIELDNCPLITDASLEHLKSCHSLERIELYDCQQITRAGIKRLRVKMAASLSGSLVLGTLSSFYFFRFRFLWLLHLLRHLAEGKMWRTNLKTDSCSWKFRRKVPTEGKKRRPPPSSFSSNVQSWITWLESKAYARFWF